MMPAKIFSLEDHHKKSSRHRQELTLLPVGDSFVACQLSDALTGEGINHSDHVHCMRLNKVKNGELAIVNTPYGLMLRRYFGESDYIRLEAANAQFPTLCLPPQDVHTIGKPYKLERDVRREGEAA